MPRTMKTYFLQFCSLKCVLSIFIYNIAIQNTDFSVLQKSSKHFLISIFFHKGRGDTPLPDPPPARHFLPRTRASPLFGTIHAPPFHQILDPPLNGICLPLITNIVAVILPFSINVVCESLFSEPCRTRIAPLGRNQCSLQAVK